MKTIKSLTAAVLALLGFASVRAGTPLSGVNEPEILKNAIFWLDANDASTLKMDSSGNVESWTSKDANHVVAASTASQPRYDTTNYGIPTVDFGGVGNGKDMRYTRFTNIRTVFEVIKIAKSPQAFLLGDTYPDGGAYNFHRGDGAEGTAVGSYAFTHYATIDKIWNGYTAVANLDTEVIPDDSFQVLCIETSVNANSNAIAEDRGKSDTTGGRQLSELIIFDTILSDEDRLAVTAYLTRKWEMIKKETVLNKAIFWLDASDEATIDRDDAGYVKSWTSKDANHVVAASTDSQPCYDTTTYGIPTVDFGTTGSGKDMTYERFTNIRTVIEVIKIEKDGFLLGDRTAEGVAGAYNFHRGVDADGSVYGAYACTMWAKIANAWNGRTAVNDLNKEVIPDDSFQVICLQMSEDAASNCIAEDRGNGNTGGRQLSELLLFKTNLSDADRLTVTDYLTRKWGTIAAANKQKMKDLLDTATIRYDASKMGSFNMSNGQVEGWTNLGSGGATYDAYTPWGFNNGAFEFQNGVPVFQMGDTGGKTGPWIELGFQRIETVRTVFWAMDIMTKDLFFLADSDYYDFHCGTGTYGNTEYGLINDPVEIYEDGKYVPPTSPRIGGLHLYSMVLRENARVNRLSSDRGNYETASGGRALSELVIFERELGDIDRAALNIYLQNKWTTDAGWLDDDDFTFHRTTGGSWGAEGLWTKDGAPCGWQDGSVAVFDAPDATVDMDGDVSATHLYFRETTDLIGSSTLTLGDSPVVFVAEGKTVRISAPLRANANLVKMGKGALLFTAAQPGVPGVTVLEGSFHSSVSSFVARWVGGGDRANASDPGNWECTDANGDLIEDGIPTSDHTIEISEATTLNVPKGQTVAYKAIVLKGNIRLEDDCDWRGLGDLALPDGVTIETAGHVLRIGKFAGMTAAGATITDTVGNGEIWVDVPEHETMINDTVRFAGYLKFVKEGKGTFVAQLAGQTYFGGNDIVEGVFECGLVGDGTGTQQVGLYGAANPNPAWVTTVRTNGVFEIVGHPNHCNHGLVLDGGTLSCSRMWSETADPSGEDWFSSIRLTADSRIYAGVSFGLVAPYYDPASVDLGGHTLTFELAENATFWIANTAFTAGRVVTTGEGTLQFGGNTGGYSVSAAETAFEVDTAIYTKCSPEVGDYCSLYTGDRDLREPGTAVRVSGRFVPQTLWHDVLMVDGSTLDLRKVTGAWNNACIIGANEDVRAVTLAQGARVTIDLSGREDLCSGLKILDYSDAPFAGAVVALDSAAAETYMATEREDGLYLTAPVASADWTGAANDGDVLNPENWACYDRIGNPILDTDALPGMGTAVTVTGEVCFNVPEGSLFRYGSLSLCDVSLTNDCTWAGLGSAVVSDGTRIDLKGHSLTVAAREYPSFGAGEITSSVATGVLRLAVSADQTAENSKAAFTGSLRVVKEGAGTFVMSKADQTYLGGTEVAEGTLVLGTSSNPMGAGDGTRDVVVRKGATIDINRCWSTSSCVYNYVELAGTIRVRGVYDSDSYEPSYCWHNVISLAGDAVLDCGSNPLGHWNDSDTSAKLSLNGHTLTLDAKAGQSGMVYAHNFRSDATGGRLVVTAGNLVTSVNFDFASTEVEFVDPAYIYLEGECHVRDFSYGSKKWRSNNPCPVNVHGVYTAGTYRPLMTLQDGATLDLAGMTGVWNAKGEHDSWSYNGDTPGLVTFGEGTIFVDVQAQGLSFVPYTEVKVVDWDAAPAGTVFKPTPAAKKLGMKFIVKDDGLYALRTNAFMIIMK